MFDRPILIYSEYCQYSKEFLKTLMKHPELFDSFIRMCIDTNPQTKKRPETFYEIQKKLDIKITKVPTIITPGPSNLLSDKDAFKWLEEQISCLSKKIECVGFNQNEMTSLSDSYANFGSTDLNDATSQSYKFFINKELPNDNYLNTTQTWTSGDKTNGFLNDLESSSKNIDYATKQNERRDFDNSKQTASENKASSQKQNKIDFTNPNFGLSDKNNNSVKENDLDKRLNQLLQDREVTDNKLQQNRKFY